MIVRGNASPFRDVLYPVGFIVSQRSSPPPYLLTARDDSNTRGLVCSASLLLEMPPSWRDEYVLSLKDVERNNPVNMELIQTCPCHSCPFAARAHQCVGSQMADRIAALEAEKLALEARISTQNADKTTKSSTTASVDPGVTQLRLELAESLRSKGVAETRLRAAGEELDKLRARTKGDAGFIRELGTEMAELRTKLRDREHELREKKKLLDVRETASSTWHTHSR